MLAFNSLARLPMLRSSSVMRPLSRAGPALVSAPGRTAPPGGADAFAVRVPAVVTGGHPDAVAETPGRPARDRVDGSGRVVRGAHSDPNNRVPARMPAGRRVPGHHQSSASTAWWASRMQAGTPTPRN